MVSTPKSRGDGAMAEWSIANIVNEIEAMKVPSMEAAKPTRQPKASKAANASNSTASQEEPQMHEFSEGNPFFSYKRGGLDTLTKEGLRKEEKFHRDQAVEHTAKAAEHTAKAAEHTAKAEDIKQMQLSWDKDKMKEAQTAFLASDNAIKANHENWRKNKTDAYRRKLLPGLIDKEQNGEKKTELQAELAVLKQRAEDQRKAYGANRGKKNGNNKKAKKPAAAAETNPAPVTAGQP